MAVAVGGWVIGMFSSGAGAAIAAGTASTLMTVAAGAIGGAIIGASIGAISSLVMDGDIGKGILFGAIGGAVAGGISGYFQGVANAATQSAAAPGSTAVTSSSGWESVVADGGKVVGSAGGQTVMPSAVPVPESGFNFGIDKIGDKLGESFGDTAVEGLFTMIGKGMEGSAAEEMAKKQQEWQERENAAQRKHELQLADLRSGGGGGGSDGSAAAMYSADQQYKAAMARIEEERRQFNEQMRITEEDRANRKKALQQFRTVRQADSVQGPSILDQTSQDVQENTPPLSGPQPEQSTASNLQQYAQQEEAYG